MSDLIGLPIGSFASAKGRLAAALGEAGRAGLARTMAEHTLRVARSTAPTIVVSSADDVLAWSHVIGVDVIADGGSLNGAAVAIVQAAGDGRWMVLHADLPLLSERDLGDAWLMLADHELVLAPSHDGGTSLIAGSVPWTAFAYGPGSFHRHLAAAPAAGILVRRGLALDVDTPAHLRWLNSIVDA
ncbi:MAG: 2-phospho-L-lactate guanylyltransferase [Acidimicrobiia bacterium]|nr:2-phospho-L-lactate guanylyltransferase [Acidimicrobiia bacterium]